MYSKICSLLHPLFQEVEEEIKEIRIELKESNPLTNQERGGILKLFLNEGFNIVFEKDHIIVRKN